MMDWPDNTGVRERLFLLARIEDPNPTDWIYNSRSDRWSNGTVGFKVSYEASTSLAMLADRGIDRQTAMERIGYPDA